MSNVKRTLGAKIASTVLSVTTALWLGGFGYFIPIAAQAQTVEELQAQIQALLAQIATLQTQLTTLQGGGGATGGFSHVFNTNLRMGMTGDEVKALQQALDLQGCFEHPTYTGYFGSITRNGVNCFQQKYASEILTPLGLTAPTGFVGAGTRAKLNALYGTGSPTSPTTPTTPTTPVAAGKVKIEAGTQPSNSLAVQNAAGLPFTVFKATAGASDVTISSVTVERMSLANDASFSGIVLLDEQGNRIGLARTLNSLHQAVFTDPIVVKAGQTRTITVAGDMAASLSSYAGDVPILGVIDVKASGDAVVEGTFPITGAMHTVNATITIGSITVAVGSLDPGSSQNKKVGVKDYYFSSVRVTAGSAEKLRLMSIRWNQSGSAASTDLANVKTYIDGVAYDTTVSDDGKYYTTNFGSGIVIDKGFSKELSVRGDIVGGSGRTIDFDVYRRQDLVIKGEQYGFNITPPNGTDTSGTDDGAFHQDTNPWFDAYQVTIDSGTITVENATSVQAQNIAENVPDQPLGGFNVDVQGEDITVGSMVFQLGVGSSGGARADDVTSVTLVRDDGTVVAGPVDGASGGTVTFSSTVTFPVGKRTYTLKGKLGTDFSNNDTIAASTTPSSQWTTVRGQTTGVTITPSPTSSVTGNTMTMKAAVVTISVGTTPIAQTIVAGTDQFHFTNYQLDATNSGEDIKFASIPLEYRVAGSGASATDLTGCKLYDGATIITDTVNPSASGSSTVFTFTGTGLTVAKGTVKTLAMKCNISSGAAANAAFSWGYDDSASPSPIGIQSGQSASVTENDSMGPLMTIAASGSYTVVDDSTPGYTIVKAGSTGVTLARLKFSATDEDVEIRRVNLQLSSTATNTPIDLVGEQVTLWDANDMSAPIGTAVFGAGGDYATSSLIASGKFTVPKGSSKTMIVKGDIATITSTGPLTASGDLLIVNYDGDANGLNNGNYGVGVGSAQNISPSSSDTSLSGVRIMKAYPTFAKLSLPSNTLMTANDHDFYRFKVTAVGGDIAIGKFTFRVSSSTGNLASATTSKYSVYAFNDSAFSQPDTTFSSNGLLNANQCYFNDDPNNGRSEALGVANTVGLDGIDIAIYMDKSATSCGSGNDGTATTTYKIASGETKYFRFAADVAGVETSSGNEVITVQLQGDAAYPTVIPDPFSGESNNPGLAMGSLLAIDTDTNDDFIWSPISTTTNLLISDVDYTNGYLVPGLPTSNMSAETLTSTN